MFQFLPPRAYRGSNLPLQGLMFSAPPSPPGHVLGFLPLWVLFPIWHYVLPSQNFWVSPKKQKSANFFFSFYFLQTFSKIVKHWNVWKTLLVYGAGRASRGNANIIKVQTTPNATVDFTTLKMPFGGLIYLNTEGVSVTSDQGASESLGSSVWLTWISPSHCFLLLSFTSPTGTTNSFLVLCITTSFLSHPSHTNIHTNTHTHPFGTLSQLTFWLSVFQLPINNLPVCFFQIKAAPSLRKIIKKMSVLGI